MDPPDKQSADLHENKQDNFVIRNEELPQTDMPSSDNLCKFFKVKTRINQDFMNVQIGLLIIQYQHFQEDFVTYLANMLMCQVQFLNIFIVDPMHLYISMNAASQQDTSSEFQYLQLENNVYFLLENCRKLILQFFQKSVNENTVFNQNGTNTEQILQKFKAACIKPILALHQKIFNKNQN